MKKIMWTFAICASISLTSCSNSIEDAAAGLEELAEDVKSEPTVVGFWELSDFDMGVDIPEEQQEMFDNMLKEMIENSNLSIKDDGTYAQNDFLNGEMVSQSGTYVVDGDKMIMKSNDEEASVVISKLTETELAFQVDDNGSTMTMTYKRS